MDSVSSRTNFEIGTTVSKQWDDPKVYGPTGIGKMHGGTVIQHATDLSHDNYGRILVRYDEGIEV